MTHFVYELVAGRENQSVSFQSLAAGIANNNMTC